MRARQNLRYQPFIFILGHKTIPRDSRFIRTDPQAKPCSVNEPYRASTIFFFLKKDLLQHTSKYLRASMHLIEESHKTNC